MSRNMAGHTSISLAKNVQYSDTRTCIYTVRDGPGRARALKNRVSGVSADRGCKNVDFCWDTQQRCVFICQK